MMTIFRSFLLQVTSGISQTYTGIRITSAMRTVSNKPVLKSYKCKVDDITIPPSAILDIPKSFLRLGLLFQMYFLCDLTYIMYYLH